MYLNKNYFNPSNSIVKAFAHYFATVYEHYDNSNIDLNADTPNNVLQMPLFSCKITLFEVFNALNNLSSKCNPGPDLIANLFFQQCKYVLSPSLVYIFNLSLSSGIFSHKWKTSIIRPIPKSSSDLINIYIFINI